MNEENGLRPAPHAKLDPTSPRLVDLWLERFVRLNVRASVALPLLVSLAQLPFAWPVADDYCRAALDRDWSEPLVFVERREGISFYEGVAVVKPPAAAVVA